MKGQQRIRHPAPAHASSPKLKRYLCEGRQKPVNVPIMSDVLGISIWIPRTSDIIGTFTGFCRPSQRYRFSLGDDAWAGAGCRILCCPFIDAGFEFSFYGIQTIGLKFTIDKHIASIVPFRVLSRTSLAGSSPSTSS